MAKKTEERWVNLVRWRQEKLYFIIYSHGVAFCWPKKSMVISSTVHSEEVQVNIFVVSPRTLHNINITFRFNWLHFQCKKSPSPESLLCEFVGEENSWIYLTFLIRKINMMNEKPRRSSMSTGHVFSCPTHQKGVYFWHKKFIVIPFPTRNFFKHPLN